MTYTPDENVEIGGIQKERVIDESANQILLDILMELKQIKLCLQVLTDMGDLTADDVNSSC